MEDIKTKKTGSFIGFVMTLVIAFLLYFIMKSAGSVNNILNYNNIISGMGSNIKSEIYWFLMNFTEAQFYAGVFASSGLIIGGFLAWRLDESKSKFAGFRISYGSRLWPWVISSQILSLFIGNILLNYTGLFLNPDYNWLPTFITVVSVAPSLMLLYGPGLKNLITASIIGGTICFPVGLWFMVNIVPIFDVHGVTGNVFTMALTGIIAMSIARVIPWVEKRSMPEFENDQRESLSEKGNAIWFIRRVFADFTEAQFYGNEVAGVFMIAALIMGWFINTAHSGYGTGVVPAILLSQFVASSVGIYFYYHKYRDEGFYSTFVPVVSVGPACVLTFGGTIPVAIAAGIMGGLIGAPLAEFIIKKLPEDFHPFIGNVSSMGISTIVVTVIMQAMPWF